MVVLLSHARQPDEPADLECDRRLKRFARVQVWTTSLVETTADLREAKYDECDDERADDEGDEAVSAD